LGFIDLDKFGLGEMLKCSLEVRRVGRAEPTMESAARNICRYLYDTLQTGGQERACALVRCYKTHRFGTLPPDLQRFARRALRSDNESGEEPGPDMKCLTLIATAGDESAWNERHLSSGHQAIPLPSPKIVQRAPMISQLINQFGVQLSDVLQPSADVVRALVGKTYGVFHVEEAAGSPYIPAQVQFVERYGIRSVVGFGGSLTGGDLFAIILFTRSLVTADVADRFRTVALDVKGCFLPFSENQIFDDMHPTESSNPGRALQM
jgi:hypothetical protein